MDKRIRVGARVTAQPRKWYDGTPVKGWPDPDYVGTVLRIETDRGVTRAVVKRDRMAKPYRESLDRLQLA